MVRINESIYCLGIIAGFSVWIIVVEVGFDRTSGVSCNHSLMVGILES